MASHRLPELWKRPQYRKFSSRSESAIPSSIAGGNGDALYLCRGTSRKDLDDVLLECVLRGPVSSRDACAYVVERRGSLVIDEIGNLERRIFALEGHSPVLGRMTETNQGFRRSQEPCDSLRPAKGQPD